VVSSSEIWFLPSVRDSIQRAVGIANCQWYLKVHAIYIRSVPLQSCESYRFRPHAVIHVTPDCSTRTVIAFVDAWNSMFSLCSLCMCEDSKFWRRWLWMLLSCGTWQLVAWWKFDDISEGGIYCLCRKSSSRWNVCPENRGSRLLRIVGALYHTSTRHVPYYFYLCMFLYPRPFVWTIRNMIRLYGEQLVPRLTPKLEDHNLSAARDCLCNIFAATLYTGVRFSIRILTWTFGCHKIRGISRLAENKVSISRRTLLRSVSVE
jgi:hypothetical protein